MSDMYRTYVPTNAEHADQCKKGVVSFPVQAGNIHSSGNRIGRPGGTTYWVGNPTICVSLIDHVLDEIIVLS